MGTNAVELVEVSKKFVGSGKSAGFAVRDLDLAIAEGEFFCLLGPSGCGKTTTLRMIAGLEDPTDGEIYIQGEPTRNIPPYQRPVNTVFQNYALFPHLTVFQNVAFGLEMERLPRATIHDRVRENLDLVRLGEFASRYPRQLSGGQQQRVALARALVKRPRVLLLDEPLGALDLKLRRAMQIELKQMQKRVGITFIYVTHDQEEAMTMADRVGVMYGGRLLQVGNPFEIYEYPTTRFVADFIGESNFLSGPVVSRDGEGVEVSIAGYGLLRVRIENPPYSIGQNLSLAIRPEKVAIEPVENPECNPHSRVGIVREVIYRGAGTAYLVELSPDLQIAALDPNIHPKGFRAHEVGSLVRISFPPESARVVED